MDKILAGLAPLQNTLKKSDSERAQVILEGTAGGGAVKVALKGDLTIQRVTISPAAATAAGDDLGMLEDLVAAAANDALARYRARYGATPEQQLQKALAGSDIGSLLGPMLGGLGGLGR